jgi:hypothetical protein
MGCFSSLSWDVFPHISLSAATSAWLTASHPNSEVKQVRAGVVLRWGTTREGPVLRFFCTSFSSRFSFLFLEASRFSLCSPSFYGPTTLARPHAHACMSRCSSSSSSSSSSSIYQIPITRNIYGLQASTVFSVQARGRNQRDGLGWGLVRKDEVSWGRSFSSRRAASSQRELLHGVLDGSVGGRHGSLGPVCVSAMGRTAGVGDGARYKSGRLSALHCAASPAKRGGRRRARATCCGRGRRCREPCRRSGHTSCAGRRAAAGAPPSTIASDEHEVAASKGLHNPLPRVVHARHVAEPAELPPRHVEVGRVEPEPARQVLGRDVVLPRVLSRHMYR